MERFQRKHYLILLFAAELIIFITLITIYFPFTPDDGFIYLYGARQLSMGEIPNYTPGENPTNAFGSAVWLLILAPAFLLGVPPLIWGKIAGVLLLLGTVGVMARILRLLVEGLERGAAFAAAGVLLCLPFAVASALNLLDTLLATFALLLALYYLIMLTGERRHTGRLGLAVGLVLVSRPDAFLSGAVILAAAVITLFRRSDKRTKPLLMLLLGMLPAILFLAGTVIAFGEVLPNSAAAKTPSAGELFSPSLVAAAMQLLLKDFSRDSILFLIYLSLIPFFFATRNRAVAIVMILLSLLHLAIFLITRDWMGLHRLYLPSIAVALAAFLSAVYTAAGKRNSALLPIAILVLLAPMSYSHWKTFVGYNYAYPGSPAEQMGRFIAEHKLPGSYLMTCDMGVVPYFGEIPAIDSNDAPICNSWRRTHLDDIDYIFNRRMDFIVMVNARADGSGMPVFSINEKIFTSRFFHDNYTRIGVATWRPTIEDYQERGFAIGYGRYFHLYVSKRIAERMTDRRFIVF